MMRVLYDDRGFDLWMEALSNKMSDEAEDKGNALRVSSNEYLQHYAKVYGEEE